VCRKHDDGGANIGGPEFGDEVEAFSVRQLPVEQDRVIRIEVGRLPRIRQGHHVIDDDVVFRQRIAECTCHLLLVLHQKNPHALSLLSGFGPSLSVMNVAGTLRK
jgi:hypothetical protein